ncbi:MAG: hypothetical protein Q4F21_10345, partial [Lachnospiraceae bacterium]|nr:hypothetical protein [Lachnospiraceae bacterium]
LNGTVYTIPGNFSTEYAIKIKDTIKQVEDAENKEDLETAYNLLKDWVFELIKMDKSKTITMDNVINEFGDYQLLEALFREIFSLMS